MRDENGEQRDLIPMQDNETADNNYSDKIFDLVKDAHGRGFGIPTVVSKETSKGVQYPVMGPNLLIPLQERSTWDSLQFEIQWVGVLNVVPTVLDSIVEGLEISYISRTGGKNFIVRIGTDQKVTVEGNGVSSREVYEALEPLLTGREDFGSSSGLTLEQKGGFHLDSERNLRNFERDGTRKPLSEGTDVLPFPTDE